MKGPTESALLTDLYQLTMPQAYWQHRMDDIAVFELFVRKGARGRRRSPPGQRSSGPCFLMEK